MFVATALLLFILVAAVHAQQAGNLQIERHPKLTWQQCSAEGNCTSIQGSVVLDANKRWIHSFAGYSNCYDGSTWDSRVCSDPVICAKTCALEGADYAATYGITTSGDSVRLKLLTRQDYSYNVGSRIYLMAPDDKNYQMFKLLNSEFSFDVDVSTLPCGINGALYFAQMDADGGMAKYANNKAGAKYGTGYCDAQCPRDLTFINGEANLIDWTPSDPYPSGGTGRYGSCCNEVDVWEANNISNAYLTHGCTAQGQTRCSGAACGGEDTGRYDGICDRDGCDFNPYRLGNETFYGPGMTIDTNSKFTVVTQFLTSTNTSSGVLSEIRRLYIQNGKVIQNSRTVVSDLKSYDSITTNFCDEQKAAFGDTNDFAAKGGLTPVSQAMEDGMVLTMSISNDRASDMIWLDGNYPSTGDPSIPGIARGTCPAPSGISTSPDVVSPSALVTFSNIKLGPHWLHLYALSLPVKVYLFNCGWLNSVYDETSFYRFTGIIHPGTIEDTCKQRRVRRRCLKGPQSTA